MDKNILYYGIELDEDSKELLKEKFGEHPGWKIFCHHMTSIFNRGGVELTAWEERWFKENEDKMIFLIVTHYAESDSVAAVRVMTNAPCRNRYRHITLGVNPEKGGKPVDSNDLTGWTLTEPMILTGHTKIWMRYIKREKKKKKENLGN